MSLLLSLLLLQAVSSGVVTGTVKSADGTPASGVRVYAIALRDALDGPAGVTVLEVLAETDAAGRFRLEARPGRYYIASGSVDSPTYYPDTTNISASRPVTIEAGAQIEGINFSSYVIPRPSAAGFATFATFAAGLAVFNPPPTFSLSGVIRLADGSPANDVEVLAVPTPVGVSSQPVLRARSDSAGRFRLYAVANSYYIVAGTPDAARLYPGTADIGKATLITVRSQSIDKLDFTVPGGKASGHVLAAGGEPAIGASIRIHRTSLGNSVPLNASSVAGFLPRVEDWETAVETPDGSFSVAALPDGNYSVEASAESSPVETKQFVLAGGAVRDLDFKLQIAALSGRVVFDDGKPATGMQNLGSVLVSTLDSAEQSSSTIFRISDAGTFTGVLDPGEYNLTLPSLPPDYNLTAIVSGGRDLLANSLKVTSSEPVKVEIRLERLFGK